MVPITEKEYKERLKHPVWKRKVKRTKHRFWLKDVHK